MRECSGHFIRYWRIAPPERALRGRAEAFISKPGKRASELRTGARRREPQAAARESCSACGRLVPQLARQCPARFAAFAPLASVAVAFPRFTRCAPHQLRKVFCRLDREWLDCIVFETHFEQLSKPVFRVSDR